MHPARRLGHGEAAGGARPRPRPPAARPWPGSRAPRRPRPGPRPLASRMGPARLGAPRGQVTGRSLPGDLQRLLGARRAAGARSQRRHFQGSLGARPGRAAPGTPAPARRPRPGRRPGPASRAPARGARVCSGRKGGPAAPEDGERLAPSARGARRRRSLYARALAPSRPAGRPGPGAPCLSLGPLLCAPHARPRWPAPGSLPRQRRLTLSQPGPPGYFSDAVTLFKTEGEKTGTGGGNRASSVQAKLPPRAGTCRRGPPPARARLPGGGELIPRPARGARPPGPGLPGALTRGC